MMSNFNKIQYLELTLLGLFTDTNHKIKMITKTIKIFLEMKIVVNHLMKNVIILFKINKSNRPNKIIVIILNSRLEKMKFQIRN